MTRTDRDGLKLAIEFAKAESEGRRQQIEAKLADQPWLEVAKFAAYGCQMESMKLKPWQLPPCAVDEEPESDPNKHGLFEAWSYRQRLLAAGLSVWEPDPLGALARVEKRQ